MPAPEPITADNAKAAVVSPASQNVAAATAQSAAAAQSGLAAAAPPPVTKQDRLSSILKGIAAVAAEVGPDFIHSTAGTNWLGVGELALQILGDFV